jgi:tRNA dimethylallyltransferase
LGDYYSAAQFEQDALALLNTMFATNQYAVMCGGSMMYVDAVTRGIDDLPTISEAVRTEAYRILNEEGIEAVKQRLQTLDPTYLQQVDINNHKRLVHALEICMEAGVPYSSLRTGKSKPRPFKSIKFAFNYNRDELFSRINARVDAMVANGLLDEAKRVYHLRHLNSLNTVGYKEMFAYLDGTWDFETAVARMAKNTRVYAKKQLTWLHRDADVIWLGPHSNDVVADVMQHLV